TQLRIFRTTTISAALSDRPRVGSGSGVASVTARFSAARFLNSLRSSSPVGALSIMSVSISVAGRSPAGADAAMLITPDPARDVLVRVASGTCDPDGAQPEHESQRSTFLRSPK